MRRYEQFKLPIDKERAWQNICLQQKFLLRKLLHQNTTLYNYCWIWAWPLILLTDRCCLTSRTHYQCWWSITHKHNAHCMKSVQTRSKSPYSVRIQENTDQKKHRIWTLFTQLLSTKLKLQSGSSMNNILATNRVLPQGDRMSVNKLTFYLAQAFREEHQKHSFAKTHFVPHDYCYPRKTSMLNINM